MPLSLHTTPRAPLVGLAITLGLHVLLLALATQLPFRGPASPLPPDRLDDPPAVLWLKVASPETDTRPPEAAPEPAAQAPRRRPDVAPPAWTPQEHSPEPRTPLSQAAPPAPTSEEWAFASRYALKNGKAYRYTWGLQVRSMMGTAVEGPDQGWVRFRVEIAPDGRLAALQTLWATSATAERLARRAIESMPAWPPTPSGRPLVFERTIAFTPHGSDGPPLYKDDCLPDPPEFKNPFAWDGRSAREPVRPQPAERPDPQALEDCMKQLPQDSIEAEAAHDERLKERWASPRLGR